MKLFFITFIVMLIGFVFYYLYFRISEPKTTSKKTCIIVMFILVATFSWNIGSDFMGNMIQYSLEKNVPTGSDISQEGGIDNRNESTDKQNPSQNDKLSQQENTSNTSITVDNSDENIDKQDSRQNEEFSQQKNTSDTNIAVDNSDNKSVPTDDSAIQDAFQNIESFSTSKLIAKEINEKWGYMNQAGEVLIPFQYDYALTFSEGFAAVRKGYSWGFIDEKGNAVIPFSYD